MKWINGKPYDMPQPGEIIQEDWLGALVKRPVAEHVVGTQVIDPLIWLKPIELPAENK